MPCKTAVLAVFGLQMLQLAQVVLALLMRLSPNMRGNLRHHADTITALAEVLAASWATGAEVRNQPQTVSSSQPVRRRQVPLA
jgi:hypothetical protein